MLQGALLVLLGLAFLVVGGNRVVEGASGLARELGLSTLFIGVTFVAIGSSIPEIATAVYAGLYDTGDFLVGHVVGSATSQITLGVGVVALLAPLALDREEVVRYGGGMLLAMAVMLATIWSGVVTRIEGLFMVVLYLGFLSFRFDHEDYGEAPETYLDREGELPRDGARLVVGVALVAVGGHLLVTNSRELAALVDTPPYLIGLLTGLGTTAPEIAIAAAAVHRDEGSIAIGTLFGSNITDPLFSFGVGALVGGVHLTHVSATVLSVGYMIAVSAVVVGVFYLRERMSRAGALACIALYLPAFLL